MKWARKNRVSTRTSIVTCVISCLVIAGCTSWFERDSGRRGDIDAPPERPSLVDEGELAGQIAEDLGGVAENVGESADSIDRHANDIEAATPPESRPAIKPSLDGIGQETDELRQAESEVRRLEGRVTDLQGDLVTEQERVKNWTDYASEAEAENAKLLDQIRELRDKNAQQFKQMLAWIGVVSVAGIGVCLVLAIWTRSKVAIAVAVGFAATLATSIAVTMFMKEIALVTIIVLGTAFLGVIGYVGWQFFASRKMEEELVHTGELAKQYLPLEAREKLFGYGAEPGKVDEIQSKVTKERVKQIREYNDKKRVGKNAPRVPELYRPGHSAITEPQVVSGQQVAFAPGGGDFIVPETATGTVV